MRYFIVIFIVIYATLAVADYNPCNGLARLGEDCDSTEDCTGAGVVCRKGNCTCHPFYEEKKNKGSSYCGKVPDKIGDECDGKCRHPMFCRSGKCTCVTRGTSKVVKGHCVVESKVGDQCKSDEDCTQPFSACTSGTCSCIAGTSVRSKKVGATTVRSCVAAKHCPSGTPAGQKCIRHTNNQQVINNYINSGGQADNCPDGQFCVTSVGSPIGHCCKAVCALGDPPTPAGKYSCEPGASNPCPSASHYCHRVSGTGYSFALCCRRPCDLTSPNAVFIKGVCHQRGYVNAPCEANSAGHYIHQQCDAKQTMLCQKGSCVCNAGYEPFADIFTSTRKNPPQMCQKKCDDDLGRDGDCFKKVTLGGKCYIQEQCTANAGCYRGKCTCQCGFDVRGNSCRLPAPTKTTKRPPIGGGGQPGGNGEDPLGDLVSMFQNFLKGIGQRML